MRLSGLFTLFPVLGKVFFITYYFRKSKYSGVVYAVLLLTRIADAEVKQ